MNRLPPYSSARCSFISLPFLRTIRSSCFSAGRLTHSLTFIKDRNSASSKRHAASTSNNLEVSKLFGQDGHYVLPVQQGLPTHPSGAGRVQHNKKVAAKQWKWTKWEESTPPTPLRTVLSDSRGSKKKMRLIRASVEMFALLEQRFVLWPFLNKEATSPSEDQYFTSCSSFKHNYFLLELERDFSLNVKGCAALKNQIHKHRSGAECLFVLLSRFLSITLGKFCFKAPGSEVGDWARAGMQGNIEPSINMLSFFLFLCFVLCKHCCIPSNFICMQRLE